MGQMKRDMQCEPLPDNLYFREHQQGSFDLEGAPFCASSRAFLHRRLKGANKFRPAIWIARIIQYVCPKIDTRCSHDFRMCCCDREKDEIPSWYIGDRNALAAFVSRSILRNGSRTGECRSSYRAKIQIHYQMIGDAQSTCDLASPLHLHAMALPVSDREEEELQPLLLGQRCCDGGIQSSARQHDCSMTRRIHHMHSRM